MSGCKRPEPLWLDLHLAERFRRYFGERAELPNQDGTPGGREALRSLLHLWQWEKLTAGVRHALHGSLHYRKALDRAALEKILDGECPGAEAARAALGMLLQALPFTFPKELAEAPESFLAVSHGDVSGIISLPTSGTTGAGKRIFCTEEDLAQTAAFFQHGMQFMVRPGRGDHVALLMSGERPGSVGDLLTRAMRDLGVKCSVPGFVPLSREGEDAMMERLIELAPTCIVGVPGQLLLLARHKRAGELARSLRSVLLSGDSVTPVMREAIAKGLGAEVFIHYGLTETGLGGAVECLEHAGSHMREADLVHEIVDGQGAPLPDGQWGEIAITTLTRRAMPLFRYRTGDEGRILPEHCPCGSVFRRLQVRGRLSERVTLPGGASLHITDLDARLYALPFVQSYSAVLHESGAQACLALNLRIVGEIAEQALDEAQAALADMGGVRIVRVFRPGEDAGQLPLLLRAESAVTDEDGGSDALRRRQAKQTFLRSDVLP